MKNTTKILALGAVIAGSAMLNSCEGDDVTVSEIPPEAISDAIKDALESEEDPATVGGELNLGQFPENVGEFIDGDVFTIDEFTVEINGNPEDVEIYAVFDGADLGAATSEPVGLAVADLISPDGAGKNLAAALDLSALPASIGAAEIVLDVLSDNVGAGLSPQEEYKITDIVALADPGDASVSGDPANAIGDDDDISKVVATGDVTFNFVTTKLAVNLVPTNLTGFAPVGTSGIASTLAGLIDPSETFVASTLVSGDKTFIRLVDSDSVTSYYVTSNPTANAIGDDLVVADSVLPTEVEASDQFQRLVSSAETETIQAVTSEFTHSFAKPGPNKITAP